jgi:YHS domain-containing protein
MEFIMNIKRFFIGLLALFALSGAANAGDYAHSVPAVQGYDVVSYQTGKRPIKGNGNFTSDYQGATYLFSSKSNLTTFENNPAQYVPAYGGYCAFGVSVGKKFIGDPEVWRVIDGTLYLNLDAGIQDEWFKDIPGRIQSADKIWKDIEHKSPSSL